jgi:DNA polymerase-3 subunit alpha
MKDIKFVGLHAHSGVGSPFDGFGYPQDHMSFCYDNGGQALALTDHGNMNGFAYQVLHAKKMKKEGKNFKPIFGVEAYFIPCVNQWRKEYEEYKSDKKKAKTLSDDQSGTNVEEEGATKSKGRSINRSRHLVLIAMNQTGLNNIFKLVSESYSEKYFYRKPRMDYNLLSKYSDGVIAMSACLGGVYAGCYWENIESGEEAVLECMRETTRTMVGIFGDRWYGELQWNAVPEQHTLNRLIIKVAGEFGVKLVSTADSHYPNPDAWKDRELYKRLGWLGRGAPEWLDMTLPGSIQDMEYELYPKNGEQMWEDYKKYSEGYDYEDELILASIEESHTIAFERVEEFIPDTTVRLPDFVVPAGRDEDDYLRDLALGGLKLMGKLNSDYSSRLDSELKVIADRGFSKYFLTMKAISDKTGEVQLAGPGRGSAAGSLVAYALGITQVDPIKYGLLFSRFLRSDATDYPDIDYDVSDPMILKDMLIEQWGSDTVVPISNWNTLQLRSLLKDISKFYEIPFTEVNAVTNVMLKEATPAAKRKHGIKAGVYTPTFEETIEYSDTLKAFLDKYPHVKTHVMALYGSYRSCSRHAGGVVVGEKLDQYMPLISSKGVRQTPWSEGQNVRQLEPLGFIKFDILGLSTLRMIESTIERILIKQGNPKPSFAQIRAFYDEFLHPDKIDLHDQDVYENIFHKGKWAGIFQFTEKGAQSFAQKVMPKSIIDISAITSIYRPGPLSAKVDKQYVNAINDPLSVNYAHELVEEVTKETYGFLIFQEQIALLAYHLGDGITMDEANLLRKVLTKKGTGKGHEVKEAIKKKFIKGSTDKGLTEEKAEELWKTFEYFSGYGFNKSHAVSYSIISFQCAWLYNYYPTQWMCSFLDREPDTRKEKAINIAKSHGFTISDIDINVSGENWEAIDSTSLVAPLTTIKGLGEKAVEEIIAHRPFMSVDDLLFHEDVVYRKLNKKALVALSLAGALKSLQDDRFLGDEHFHEACFQNRPKNPKKLLAHIEEHKDKDSFSKDRRIENLTEITGIFPINMVYDDITKMKLESRFIPPISEFDPDLGACWGIPRNINVRKSKNKKWFAIIDLIDSNNVLTKVRIWNIDYEKIKHQIVLNEVYAIKPNYSDGWGFSTRGHVDSTWCRMTVHTEE